MVIAELGLSLKRRDVAMSLHSIGVVELMMIVLMIALSCSISVVATRTILEAVFLFMMRSSVPEFAKAVRREALALRDPAL
jgi:hypothetical protein